MVMALALPILSALLAAPAKRTPVATVDGETSGNRVFKDRLKAEKWAARQEKSPVVKKAKIETFAARGRDWLKRRTNWRG